MTRVREIRTLRGMHSTRHTSSLLPKYYLGFDFGTSGARANLIDAHEVLIAEAHCAYDILDPISWLQALANLCAALPKTARLQIHALSIAGTSSTMLLSDGSNVPLSPPLLYNDTRAAPALTRFTDYAPQDSATRSASSSLAKLIYFLEAHGNDISGFCSDQASWSAAMLTGRPGYTDYHNALKMGYDLAAMAWPAWLKPLKLEAWLPRVVSPGSALGNILPAVARKLDLPARCTVRAGTTDSIAAFMASGARRGGVGVTSLGSTLVIKLLSRTRVDAPQYGVYSHRYGDRWLAGGASNTGGAVLRQFFDAAQLGLLSQRIDPDVASALDYYPLPARGERFPVNDPTLEPRLTPRPRDDAQFLGGLFEGIARIEAQGYALLAELGATPVHHVFSAGGGAHNATWTALRSRVLGLPVSFAAHIEAAYGAACLAKNGSDLLCYNDE